jgi:hypothetical protein
VETFEPSLCECECALIFGHVCDIAGNHEGIEAEGRQSLAQLFECGGETSTFLAEMKVTKLRKSQDLVATLCARPARPG